MTNKFIKLLTLLLVLFNLCSCAKESIDIKYEKIEDLNGQPFSIMDGTVFDELVSEKFPDSEKQFYSTAADCVTSITEGKTEALISEGGYIRKLCEENEALTYFNEPLETYQYAVMFQKSEEGQKKLDDFNLFLKEYIASGQLKKIKEKWFSSDEYNEIIDYENLENINGVFSIACEGYTYPFNYYSNGKITGYDIEIAYNYCKERGYVLDINRMEFPSILPAVRTGKVDAGISGIIYTEERAQSFLFSNVYATEDTYVCIRKDKAAYKYNNINDLKGQKVGTLAGGIGAIIAEREIEDVKPEEFNTTSDAVQALDANKIEALALSSCSLTEEITGRDDIKVLGLLDKTDVGLILPKDSSSQKLLEQVNEFIKKTTEDGRLAAWEDEWFNGIGEKDIDYTGLDDKNGTINFALCSSMGGNVCYVKGDKYYGLDVEIIVEFAKEYGYAVNFQDYSFSGMLAAISTGKADIGGSNISITEERKQSMNFTDPIYADYVQLYVKSGVIESNDVGFIESIKDSFYKTFIFENRYILFLDGVGSTLLITFLSIIFGFVLGTVLFFVNRKNNKVMNKALEIYSWLLNGMPTVVLIMVFFYIIFGKTKIDGIIVSIIAFTCLFSVSIMGLLKTCFMSIDIGQFEAAYALGYSKRQTIWKVIVPEIAQMFFPTFKTEIISLLKATSIVGYIAVQDLTKASDIVRSRTYEAFFPLIATTIIYFILGGVINLIINIIEKAIDPKHRTKEEVLKGVNYHD